MIRNERFKKIKWNWNEIKMKSNWNEIELKWNRIEMINEMKLKNEWKMNRNEIQRNKIK